MSSKKSRLDLLVRVRYSNPLTSAPFPPQLFDLQTDIERLGDPRYLDDLAASTPLPMLVDSEMGMPLDLNVYDRTWNGDDEDLNVVEDQELSAEDLALLAPLADVKPVVNGSESTGAPIDVSWMRNSSLFTRKAATKGKQRMAVPRGDTVDASEAAQIMMIDQTFSNLDTEDLAKLRHPDGKRADLRVIESYDFLPDTEAWSNSYVMVKYPERPAAALTAMNPSARASSPQLDNALLKMTEEDNSVMQFMLPEEDGMERLQQAYEKPIDDERYNDMVELATEDATDTRIDDIFPSGRYNSIRTYEVVSQSSAGKEVLLSVVEKGDPSRPSGAYFSNIQARTLLRKTRIKQRGEVDESEEPMWDTGRIGFRIPGEDAREESDRRSLMVNDPLWVNAQLRELHGEDVTVGQGEAIADEE